MAAAAAAVVSFAVTPMRADAHAVPRAPDASQDSAAEPEEIRLRFSERIEPGASAIVVTGPDGVRIQSGAAIVDRTDPRVLMVRLQANAPETYTAFWKVISADDGHFSRGTYTFAHDAPVDNAVLADETDHSAALPETFAVGAELAGQALIIGALAMLSLRRTLPLFAQPGKSRRLRRRIGLVALAGLLLTVGGVALYLAIRTQQLQGEEFSSGAALRAFLPTAAGRSAALRAVVASAAALCAMLSRERWGWALMMLAIFVRARMSHAAAADVLPVASILINATHLFGKELWIGGSAVFCVSVLPLLRGSSARDVADAWKGLHRMAIGGLFAGGVTGCYIVWLHLKDTGNVLSSHWGMRLFPIVAFATVLLLLRLYQHRFLRRMARDAVGTEAGQMAWIALPVEAVVGVVILVLSGQMIITTPPLAPDPRPLLNMLTVFCVFTAIAVTILSIVLMRQTRSLSPAPQAPFTAPERAAAPIFALASLPALLLLLLHAHPHLAFQQSCERAGHVWTEAVPMRADVPVADIPVMGCTVIDAAGRHHFADESGYAGFLKLPTE